MVKKSFATLILIFVLIFSCFGCNATEQNKIYLANKEYNAEYDKYSLAFNYLYTNKQIHKAYLLKITLKDGNEERPYGLGEVEINGENPSSKYNHITPYTNITFYYTINNIPLTSNKIVITIKIAELTLATETFTYDKLLK